MLLTSYTFSADWFESTLYPLLRQDDCEAIVIMVDVREAHFSIDNTKSQFGGSRYRVVSATGAPGGIFHPKFAYLETAEGDVLVVSSGNLTAAGQGGQLEVLDAVSVTTEPELFEEFSQFLSGVATVANLADGPERNAVSYFSKRALAQSKAYPRSDGSTRTAFLVSSLGTSAGAKFVQLVKKFVPTPTVLTVLSPYHDKDVRAARKLQNEIRPKKVQYALGQTADGDFLAPFADKIKQDPPKHFVTPRLTAEKGGTRPLHAKWFDVCNGSGAAVSMTGSVNATYKSLWTTDNVELALARVSTEERAPIWKTANGAPIYEPCEFPSTSATAQTVLCKASLSLASELEIEFRPQPTAAPLRIRLFQGQTTNCEESQHPYAGGSLALKMTGAVMKSLKDGALWVEVEGVNTAGEPFTCQSWVNVEQELIHRPAEVDVYKAMNRMEQGVYEPEDEYLLLAVVHFELTGRKLSKQGGPSRRGGAETPPEDDVKMTKEELEQNHTSRGIIGGADGGSRTLRMLQLLSKRLNEEEDEPKTPDDDEELPPTEEENEDADGENAPAETQADKRIRKKRADALEAVRCAKESVKKAIDKALASSLSDSKASWLIPYLLGRDLRKNFPKMQSSVPSTGADAGTILFQALEGYSGADLTQECKQNLLPVFACAGAAACLAFGRHDKLAPYPAVLSTLEGFAGRAITVAELQAIQAQDFSGKSYVMLDAYDWNELLPELVNIAQAPRLADRIDQLLRFGLTTSEPIPAALTAAETSFIAALKAPPTPTYKRYSIVPELDPTIQRPGCPQCRQVLSHQEATRLKQKHIAVCEASCRRPVVARTILTATHQFFAQGEAFIAPQRQGANR